VRGITTGCRNERYRKAVRESGGKDMKIIIGLREGSKM
jgi:hypothetical protein